MDDFNSGTPSIQGAGINFSYEKGEARRQVLFDCALTLHPGEMAVLTGPSGAGKTTLLTLIGALRALEDGSLRVLGCELNGLRPADQVRLRRRIGFIFQQHNLIEALTAFDNVRLAMHVQNGYTADEFRNRPAEMLTALGLGHLIRVKPQKLSGGERQRVAIARALVNRPDIVLADEPTAALDRDNVDHVVQHLRTLAIKEGCTILIVTHDRRIMDHATRVITMVDGRIVADEPA
jgi:putative ABC transport system ATP-binding protein